MKKLLCFAFGLFAFFEVTCFSYGVTTYQPQYLGYVSLSLSSGTATDIMNSTAPTVGYVRWCTNCGSGGNVGTVCFSTATTGAFQFVLSTGTACK